jgi:HEPN pEK499 p136
MTLPAQTLPEIMRRTLKNLDMMYEIRDQRLESGINVDHEGPFEVTQLVNSFLGALAHPWEGLCKGRTLADSHEITELAKHLDDAWTLSGSPLSLEVTLGYLRNAFAHGNVEFLPDPSLGGRNGDIGGVRLWNCRRLNQRVGEKRRYEKNWEIELRVDQLRTILVDFSKLANRLYDPTLVDRPDDCNFNTNSTS